MTTQDLYALIEDVIKVNPDATDATKLQGTRHRLLLKTLVDYVASVAGGSGDFPFDWTTPSNAFGGYSNSETTFKAGMNKFLHRDQPPAITSFYAENSVRERGADRAVTLHYAVQKTSYNIAKLIVGDTIYTTPTVLAGSVVTATDANTDTVFTCQVTDTANNVVQATTGVAYRDKRISFTSSVDLLTASDATVSSTVRDAGGDLSPDRFFTTVVACTNSKVYVAYPVTYNVAGKIILNDFEDNSFIKRIFSHTNNSGFTQDYILYVSENNLFGNNKVEIK